MYFSANIKTIREFWQLSQAEFGLLIGATRGMVMQYERRGSMPKNETMKQIVETTGFTEDILLNTEIRREDVQPLSFSDAVLIENFRANPDDYETSKGTLSEGQHIRNKKAFGDGAEDPGLIYVPISAQAGYSRNYEDAVYLKQLERLFVPGLPYKGDNFRYFEVEGDSMYPTIEEGMQVIGEKVDLNMWNKKVKNFYIYVIVTDNQILIKRLAKKADNVDYFAMISDNEIYPQEKLYIKDIKELWLVKRKLDWGMAPPKQFEIKV